MDASEDSSTTDLEFDWAIGLNRMAMNILGIWPNEDKKKIWKTSGNFRVFIGFIFMTIFLLIPQIWSLLLVRRDLMLVIDNLQLSFPVMSAIMKCTILWWKKEAISSVISELKNDWLKEKTADEKSTMIKRAQLTRKITIAGYLLLIFMWLILNALPCLGLTMRYVTNLTDPGQRPLPVQSHFFYDVTKKWNFLVTFVFQTVSLMFAATYFTGVDCFYAHIVLHVCGQIENLSQRLTKLCSLGNFRANLSFCVNEHVRIIRLARIYDNVVNLLMLGHLFIFTVLFCFQGFLFIKIIKEGGDVPILRFLWQTGAIITLLLHMFVYCFVGEILVMCCEEMYGAAYNNKWYSLQPHEAKMLLLILMRAHPPLYITAGKMFPITMALFCTLLTKFSGHYNNLISYIILLFLTITWVIKTSVSYISVLLAYS